MAGKRVAGKIKLSEPDQLADGLYGAGNGLYLRKRGAAASWYFRFTENGKRREIGLGSASALTPTAAKRIAVKLRADIAEGKFPGHDQPQKIVPAFGSVWEKAVDHFADLKAWRSEHTEEKWRSSIRIYMLPSLGNKRVDEITRDDVIAILQPVWKMHAETGRKIRMRLEAILDYCQFMGWRTGDNPARWRGNMDQVFPARVKPTSHLMAYPWRELPQLCQVLTETESVSFKAILFGTLTASRANEFVPARWDEFDFERKVWLMPRRKDGKDFPHRVPLSSQAVSILESLPREGEFVFSRLGRGHISKETPRVLLQRLTGKGFTMHGMRSAFRDWGAEMGEDFALCELALSHAIGNAVTAAYLRTDQLERRRPLMQRWADFLLPDGYMPARPSSATA